MKHLIYIIVVLGLLLGGLNFSILAQEKQILAPDTPDEEIMHMNPQMVDPSQLRWIRLKTSMLLEQFKPLI